MELAIANPDYKQWIKDIESRFRGHQIKAAVHVNSEKIEFYWELGRDICVLQVEQKYGEGANNALSRDLRSLIPEAKGLTPVNIYYCKRFYKLYSQLFEKLPQVVEKSIISTETDNQCLTERIFPQPVEIFKPLHHIDNP